MNVTWVVFDDIESTAGGYYSPLASVRLRLIIPRGHLEAMGHRVQVLRLRPEDTIESVVPQVSGEVVIFSKLVAASEEASRRLSSLVLRVAEAVRRDRRGVIVDVCDDLFAVPEYGDFLKALVERADVVVTGSAQMAEVVRSHSGCATRIAEEPFEGDRVAGRFAPPRPRRRGLLGRLVQSALRDDSSRRPLRLLWFGHGSNFPAVLDFIPQLERLVDRYRLEFHLITSPESGAAGLCESFNEEHAARCALSFAPWSLDAMRRGLQECDLVVIPTRLADATKRVKSSNRVVQSLWSGRFVVAHPVDSYRPFDGYSWIGEDLVAGVEWALRNPREVMQRIAAGQGHVEARHAPHAIARQWEAAIEGAMDVATGRAGPVH